MIGHLSSSLATVHFVELQENRLLRTLEKQDVRLATVGVTSAVTSSPTQQIWLCGNELMRREVVVVT